MWVYLQRLDAPAHWPRPKRKTEERQDVQVHSTSSARALSDLRFERRRTSEKPYSQAFFWKSWSEARIFHQTS